MVRGKKHGLASLVSCFTERDDEIGSELKIMSHNRFNSGGEEQGAVSCDRAVELEGKSSFPVTQRLGTKVRESFTEEEKISDLEHELSQKEINMEKLRRIASSGLPGVQGLRATVWKLLLGYLPPSRNLWETELAKSREEYAKLKEEHLWTPLSRRNAECNSVDPLKRDEVSPEDHPLSLGTASPWHQYFQHTEIVEQIDRDLRRTRPGMEFFTGETAFSRKNREEMKNILVVFAKLNPTVQYVQGMNDVLAPLFYIFSIDPDPNNAGNAEADSFTCFARLLGDSLDHYCWQLDYSPAGILSTLSRLSELLKENDEELWHHLEFISKVKPQYYAFRWVTLLLAQEFDLQSILRIWDSLLSSPFGIQDFLLRVCCGMLLRIKDELLKGDFAENMKLLQHYPYTNIEHLLCVAGNLRP